MKKIGISIIIATRHREEILWETVRKAVKAIENKNGEVIIVNDGDISLNISEEFLGKIIYFNNPKKGVSSARNFGALNAKGGILFFIDDDMWINSEIIEWINSYLIENKKIDAVYNINWEYPTSLKETLAKSKIGQYILSSGYNTMWGRMHEKGNMPVEGLYIFNNIGSGSLVLQKKLFQRIGMYNESIIFQGEDIDLSNRINKLSIPIFCVFDTTLNHNHEDRLDLDGYLQRISKGYQSQFMAEKTRRISSSDRHYKSPMIFIFEFFRVSEKVWIVLYKLIPNHRVFIPITNKLTGFLSGLQRYKQWRNIFRK